MPTFSRELIDVVRSFRRAAPEQGGIISGANPSAYNASDPLPLWIIQVFIILGVTHLLAIPLAKLRQPRVIAEIIGGIILGPTVMGRIPKFTQRIFPPSSIPMLSLTSSIGLVLFLFLIGLEIDVRVLKRNAKASLTISAAGMVLPFGLGVGLAVGLYHQFVEHGVNFGHFLLFVGVAVAITAFPVLCRILTDLNLLEDHVGIIVLSAGVGNDVVGWILLALAVALTNATSGLTALWILLAASAFVLFMLYPVRWAFLWLARRTGSLENGSPTAFMMTVTLLLIFMSAFFTDVIGIHPIFGGFVAGLIIPHEGGFAIALVEKLEDLVCIVLIPLYFALSGLRTNLGLLNNGISWAYIVLICTVAFFGKFFGCAVTAKLLGFSNRESGAIGTLMSCKGLVELIVLNVGLQAGILDTRVFSMFVVHAVVLTVMTTPLTLLFYPPQHRTGKTGRRRGRKADAEKGSPNQDSWAVEQGFKTKLAVVLDRIEHLPAMMTITQLLQPSSRDALSQQSRSSVYTEKDEKAEASKDITGEKHVPGLPQALPPSPGTAHTQISIDALRLMELTARTSAVMKSSEADEILHRDAVISVFSAFGRLNRIPVTTSLSVVAQDSFPSSVATHARDSGAQLLIIPWHSPSLATETQPAPDIPVAGPSTYNPFDVVFGKAANTEKKSSIVYTNFVRKVFAESPADVALFIDRGNAAPAEGQHIFLPFFGGPDDRLALKFVVQLCSNAHITATVVRAKKIAGAELIHSETGDTAMSAKAAEGINSFTVHSATGFPDTIYGQANTETRLASDTEDNILWSRFAAGTPPSTREVQDALRRIVFVELSSSTPLRSVIQRMGTEARTAEEAYKSLLLVMGRARRLSVESHHAELRGLLAEQPHGPSINGDVTRTVGDVAAGFMSAGTNASMLVMQQAADTAL